MLTKMFNKNTVSVVLSVIVSVLFVTAMVHAATTISTNINTGGTLTVTGASTLTGNVAAAGTLTVGTDGSGTDVTFYTDTAGEEFLWDASANKLLLDGADATVVLDITDGDLQVADASRLASTTATSFKVGQVGTQHTVILSGTCDILGASVITASTTGFADCAATGVATDDLIFFTLATTSPSGDIYGFHVMGANASSTAAFITFSIKNNTGADAAPDATALFGSTTRYWVVR